MKVAYGRGESEGDEAVGAVDETGYCMHCLVIRVQPEETLCPACAEEVTVYLLSQATSAGTAHEVVHG